MPGAVMYWGYIAHTAKPCCCAGPRHCGRPKRRSRAS